MWRLIRDFLNLDRKGSLIVSTSIILLVMYIVKELLLGGYYVQPGSRRKIRHGKITIKHRDGRDWYGSSATRRRRGIQKALKRSEKNEDPQ